MIDTAYYRSLVEPILRSRRWIILSDAAAGTVQYLTDIGAPKPLVLAGSPGTGDLPDPNLAEMAILWCSGDTIMDGFRAYWAAAADLPQDVRDQIDEWDPDHSAMALATGIDPAQDIHGRPPGQVARRVGGDRRQDDDRRSLG